MKIDKNNVENILSLTPMQQGILFHYILDKDNTEYFEQLSIELEGHIDNETFKTAWQYVVDNNEMLRTIFIWGKTEENIQIILKNNDVEVNYFDIYKNQHKKKILAEIKREDKKKGFDLKNVPFRISLCKVDDEKYEMIISNHHIILDGWSTTIIINEFFEAYDCLMKKTPLQKKNKRKFKDIVTSLSKKENEEEFWKNYFKGYEGQDQIKICSINKNKGTGKGTNIHILEKTQTEIKKVLGNKRDISIASLLLGSWGILLQKYMNSKDVNFGVVLSGRNHADNVYDDVVGLFINSLPLRVNICNNESIEDMLINTNSKIKSIMEYPSTKLVDINKYVGQTNLFDVIVAIENYPLNVDAIGNDYLKAKSYCIDGSTNYSLTVGIQLFEDNIGVNIGYNKEVFSDEQIEEFARCYDNIVKYVVDNMSSSVSEIKMLDQDEINKVLYKPNDTNVNYGEFVPVYKMFEKMANKNPDSIAVVCKNQRITYKELSDKVNKLSSLLYRNNIREGDIVAVILNRTIEAVISILAVLKSGAAFLPIDVGMPIERKEFIIKDCKANAIITYTKNKNDIDYSGLIIDIDNKENFSGEAIEFDHVTKENDLAYVIYTSGTTGKPKGVMIEHKSLTNIANSWNDKYKLKEFTVNLLQLSNFYFDVFVGDFCKSLLNGGKMVICPDDDRINMVSLYDLISKEKVTMFDSNPTLISNFMEYIYENNLPIDSIKLIILGADVCSVRDFKRMYERFGKKIRIINGYGITEATVESTFYEVDDKVGMPCANLPIGKSMLNTRHYILDLDYNPLPLGVAGELYIAGDCLARGYVNNEKLTNEKFIDDPFFKGQKMYKTGDLARLLEDGNIEFLGRKDNQVKIRGYRIETGEIENVLLEHSEIKEAAVIDLEDNGDKYLCVYYVSQKELEIEELRNHLLKKLPEYMVPHNFVRIDSVPLTPNGKVDRKTLKKYEGQISKEIVLPRNEIEEELCSIWKSVLKRDVIDVTTNFFELGGNSLNATALMAKTSKTFGVNVPLLEIFKSNTVETMAKFLSNSSKEKYKKIKKVEEREFYPISPAQNRIYLLQTMNPKLVAYNLSKAFELKGKVSKEKIEEVFNKLISRHDAFRTSFDMVKDEIVQRVHKQVDFSLEYSEMEEDIDEYIKNFIRPFDFQKAPLIRGALVKQENDKYILLVDIHHIIADGVSVSIIIDEFNKLYNNDGQLKEIDYKYKDYAVWQETQIKKNVIKEQENYWKKTLGGELPILNLPTDYPRPSTKSYEGDTMIFSIGKNLNDKVREITKENNVTLYMFMLAAIKVALYKYTHQEDIIVGTPIAGRHNSEFENIVGMFVNTLAIRSYPNGEKTFSQFLNEVKKISLASFENQDYQFENLIDLLMQKRNLSRNPIFDVMFSMENLDDAKIDLKNIIVKPMDIKKNLSKFDISFYAIEQKDDIYIGIEYCTKLFKKEFIENMYRHINNILKQVSSNINMKISDIQLTDEIERQTILEDFNDTDKEYPKNCTLHEIFENQVKKTPNEVAVIFNNNKLTYEELNSEANSLARYLREKGVGADDIVGIMTKRSKEMIVGLLAILKAGGAYLPLNIDMPEERLQYIVDDSKLKFILMDDDYEVSHKINVQNIYLKEEELYKNDKSNLEKVNSSKNLAYVIYTSGSTGSPKGVMIEHGAIVNRLNWMQNTYPLENTDVILQKTSFTFDVSVWELFMWSFSGAKMCFLSQDGEKDPRVIMEAIDKNKITVLHFVPSMFNAFIEWAKKSDKVTKIENLKEIFVSGEALKESTVKKYNELFSNDMRPRLINLYGPTEATVDVTHFDCGTSKKISSIPIGKPIDNIKIYILNKNGQVLPVGVPGELCISGIGIARGYLNNPQLTKERFIYSEVLGGRRLYKTGDLAKWLPDGNIEFLGRIDTQVKLRGFRIELEEIENVILRNEKIHACVVNLINIGDDKEICAYYVGENISEAHIRENLNKSLPKYMIPSFFVKLDSLPVNKNGKIDRSRLPVNLKSKNEHVVQCENDIERRISDIWSEILKVDNISKNDDFFDLGGHSIKVISLVTRLKSEFNVEIYVNDIFNNPTIEGIEKIISTAIKKNYDRIEKVDEMPYYPMSSAQRRMYLMQKLDEQSTAYNITSILNIDGVIDIRKMENVLKTIVNRHEAFRTSFEIIDGKGVQKISSNVDFALEYKEMQNGNDIFAEAKSFIKVFDLSKSPLINVGLIKQSDYKYMLVVNMHHIISDGVSMGILIDEFSKLYNNEKLEEVGLEYKDYAVWQEKMRNDTVFKNMESYWKNTLAGDLPILKMPLDFKRPKIQSFEGEMREFIIPKKIWDSVKMTSKYNDITPFMMLLTAYNIMLYKYTGSQDIIVGSPIYGRNHFGIEKTIGMFVNMLAIRSYPRGEMTFKEYANQIRKTTIDAYENQDYQFEDLIDILDCRRDVSSNPIFNTIFSLQNMKIGELTIGDAKVSQCNLQSKESKFDISFIIYDEGDSLKVSIEYSTKVFKRETITKIFEHYKSILEQVIIDENVKIDSIKMITDAEKEKFVSNSEKDNDYDELGTLEFNF